MLKTKDDATTEYGYIRVSTKEQNEDRQLIQLKEMGVKSKNIFIDKQSGKDFNRTQYIRLKKKLKDGDTLFISGIDRLGRNYEEIQEQWRDLTKIIKCDVVVIDMPLLDTRQHKDLLGTLIADLVLQLLAYVAQNHREYILRTQAEGIEAAHLRGVKFGRPQKALPESFEQVYQRYVSGKISSSVAAKELGMPKSTFTYKARQYSTKNK